MKCPNCGESQSEVIYTVHDHDGGTTDRRRMCNGCRLRYTTQENLKKQQAKKGKEGLWK